jgi:hypothetical protein
MAIVAANIISSNKITKEYLYVLAKFSEGTVVDTNR